MTPVRPLIASGALVAALLALGPALAQSPPAAPYAGQQNRAVKALSEADLAGLRDGDGMGLAKAAELNGYPGPKHVLMLARELRLSPDQQRQIQAVYDRMHAQAVPLGGEIIVAEQALDRAFADGDITPPRLAAATAEIASLQGRLRSVHLAAHLETRPLLDPGQIARYRQLRGYGMPHQHRHEG